MRRWQRKQKQGGCAVPIRRVTVCGSGGGKIDDGAAVQAPAGNADRDARRRDSPLLHNHTQKVSGIGCQKTRWRVYRHRRRDGAGPPRSRLCRPEAAQQRGVDQTQVKDPKRVCQASRDGGMRTQRRYWQSRSPTMKQEIRRCLFLCLRRPWRL